MGAIEAIREGIREEVTGDVKFLQKLLYFFELRIPAELSPATGGMTSFIIPLVINPESYTLSEPFAVETTMTEGAGLYAEEHGIVQRVIRLRGHTGFKPRKMYRQPYALLALKPESQSHSRVLDPIVLDNISGHKHFQYLQDAVFRAYADLKRDPATAKDTRLFFHNPKDDEHWLVLPRSFDLERTCDKPLTYHYSIELWAVDKAESVDATFSEDKSLLDEMRDGVAFVKSGVDLISGALNDLTALAGELEGFVKDVGKLLDSAGTIVEAASNFVEGVTSLIEAPLALLDSVNSTIDNTLEFLDTVDESAGTVQKWPEAARQKFREIQDGCERIATHPLFFGESEKKKAQKVKDLQQCRSSIQADRGRAAADRPPVRIAPSSFEALTAMGTALTPGEKQQATARLNAGRASPEYTGSREYAVEQSDTLPSLAAKYLGDARLWQHIALANGLKAPFLLEVGAKVIIPNFVKPPEKLPLLAVLGVRAESPIAEHMLGVDFALEVAGGSLGREVYDIPIDVEGGSQDAKLVRGLDSLKQGLTMRMSIERGTDILYKHLGIQRVVSLGLSPVDMETARFRLLESIRADSRIAGVRRMTFDVSEASADAVDADLEVEVRGFAQADNIKTTVYA